MFYMAHRPWFCGGGNLAMRAVQRRTRISRYEQLFGRVRRQRCLYSV